MDRWRLYHNWNETIMRQASGPVTKEDQEVIRMYLRDTLLKNKENDLGKNFQIALKQHLSKEYHRSSFSIAFNNCKRQVQKELDNATTMEAKNKIKKEIQLFFDKQEKIKQQNDLNEQENEKKVQNIELPTGAQGKTYMEFLQEPSTTTAEFCKQLEMKINNRQDQQNQTAILVDQLNTLQHKNDFIL